ncbi:efflux RND transporter permease subunit [Gloeobacter violaceus]|uniref:Glr0382 protein n=1 Tax=Gloeobacter violaceus (strain ATCC 29082 / PCC 7421) TaxID=251221 RepID=Q7NNM9_GLOVI|nr:CusA/CzcA family heavy metal efflux RND transporter [Gloeobacter violaceus]BAC88323.1 glr0382 [Gloeobacter violaceus PCC 7421]
MTSVLKPEEEQAQKKPGLLKKWIYGALKARLLAALLLVTVVGLGINSLTRFPIDGLPDISNVQVQVITEAPALGPQEVEQLITFPVEIALTGMPRLTQMRSISKYGLSQITVVFEDGTDVYFARQLVNERLKGIEALLPGGSESPVLGPVSTGLGEIFIFELQGESRSPMELRTLMDWTVIPRLKSVPGVAEINPMGGFVKQYQVRLDPLRLLGYGITPQQVFDALATNNANSGGGYLSSQRGEQTIIRGEGLVITTDDISRVIVDRSGGTPIYVRDIATVEIGNQLRQGVVTRDSTDGAVIATVLMRAGQNANGVVKDVKTRVAEIQKELPEGVQIVPHYDRTQLITAAIKTVALNLTEGALLVTAILLIMLGNVRASIITALIIPLSMLLAITGMVIGGVSGNLMSLGAIDFGLLVDGAVFMVENIILRLSEQRPETPKERMAVIGAASAEVAKPVAFAITIVTVVYIPIFGLSGVEGKLFQPMAFTVILALVASLVLTLTLVPLACYFAFAKKPPEERETLVLGWVRPPYEWVLGRLMGRWLPVSLASFAIFAASLTLVPLLGSEFVPNLAEGSLVINVRRPPAASLDEGARQTKIIERVVGEFPEVRTIFSTTGHPELATDTNKSENSDVFVMLKPQKDWKTAKTQEELVAKIEKRLEGVIPGITIAYTQPIQQRVNELLSGDRLDVALRIYGPELDVLNNAATQAAKAIKAVPGAADVRAETITGLPVLNIKVDRERLAQYGINVREVLDTIEATRAGKVVGTVYEGRQRYALAVKFDEGAIADVDAVRRLPVSTKDGGIVPLETVVDVTVGDGLAQVSHREGERVITVGMNVRGRDLGSFVAAAQAAVEQTAQLPKGYRLVWGGQFENYQSALSRLQILVPLALALIFVLLYSSFGNLRPGILIFLNVPFSLVGGLVALYLRGFPLSVSAGVGFITLFGVAVLNGIVLVSTIRDIEEAEGIGPREAALKGAKERLRPILSAALLASIGFIPMAIASSAGAEVQRPLATVVIGGLVTCTLFTLFALPVLYPLICGPSGSSGGNSLWARLRKLLPGGSSKRTNQPEAPQSG